MQMFTKITALVAFAVSLTSVAHAQSPSTTTKAGGTAAQSSGSTSGTNGTGGTAIQSNGTTSSTNETSAARPTARRPMRGPRPGGPTKDLIINGNSAHRTIDCKGNTITINGNGNRLLLRGTCAQLNIIGSNNNVRWSGPAPVVSDTGTGNVTAQVN